MLETLGGGLRIFGGKEIKEKEKGCFMRRLKKDGRKERKRGGAGGRAGQKKETEK